MNLPYPIETVVLCLRRSISGIFKKKTKCVLLSESILNRYVTLSGDLFTGVGGHWAECMITGYGMLRFQVALSQVLEGIGLSVR